MASQFVPFLAAIAAGRSTGARVPTAGAPAASDFKPMPPLGPRPDPNVTPTAVCRPSPGTSPKVTVQRDGEAITQIRIECSCGEVIELTCAY